MRYEEVVALINDVLGQYEGRLTVRQIFYRLISPPYQYMEGTDPKYKSFDRMITKARERGDVDWRRILDRSRSKLGGDSGYEGVEDFTNHVKDTLSNISSHYSKRLWTNQQIMPVIFIEKDALSRVVFDVAEDYNVAVYPTRGFSSFTFLKEFIEEMNGERVHVLAMTDHDPSGVEMHNDLLRRLPRYGGDFIDVEKIGLTYDQITAYGLASNPTKKADSRKKKYIAKFGDRTWELDAIPPDELKRVVKTSIEKFIDPDLWNKRIKEIEKDREAIKARMDKLMS
jgi:hypothetical protein